MNSSDDSAGQDIGSGAARSRRSILAWRLVGALVLVIVGVGATLMVFRDAAFPRLLEWAVRANTGVDLQVAGNFDVVGLAPFHVEGQSVDLSVPGHRSRLQLVRVVVPLQSIFKGPIHFRELTVHGAELRIPPNTTDTASIDAGFPGLPVFESFEFEDIRVVLEGHGDAQPSALAVARLAGKAGGDGRLTVQGRGTYEQDPWQLDGQFGKLSELMDPKAPFPLSLRVELPDRQLAVEAKGNWNDPLHGQGVAANLTVTAADVAPLMDRVAPGVKVSGSLSAKGRLEGDLDALGLSGLDLRIDHGAALGLNITGDIGSLRKLDQLALRIDAHTTDAATLPLAGLDGLLRADSAQAKARLTGGPGAYRVDNLDVSVSGSDARAFKLNGNLALADLQQPAAVSTLDINVSVALPAADLAAWLPGLEERGRVTLGSRVTGASDRLALEQLDAKLTDTQPYAGTVAGRIDLSPQWQAALVGPNWNERLTALTADATYALELDLDGSASGANALLGQELPGLDSFTVKTRVAGSASAVSVNELDLHLRGHASRKAKITGALTLRKGPGPGVSWTPSGVSLDFEADGPDVAQVFPKPYWAVLGKGPWRLDGKLANHGAALSLRGLHLRTGTTDHTQTDITGEVKSLGPPGPSMFAKATGIHGAIHVVDRNTNHLTGLLGLEIKNLGRLDLKSKGRLGPAGWSLHDLSVHIKDGDKLDVRAVGSVQNIPQDPEFDLEVKSHAATLEAIANAFGHQVPVPKAFAVDGKFRGTAKRITFDGQLGLGPTKLSGRLRLETSGKRPRVELRVSTELLDLDEVDALAGLLASDNAAPEERLFSTRAFNLAWLDATDFDIILDAGKLRSTTFRGGPLKVNAINSGGRLSIGLDEMSFESGDIRGHVTIDATGRQPAFAIEARSRGLNLGKLHARLAPNVNHVQGNYAFDIEIQGRGRSPHELATTAQGHFGHVVVDGRLPVGGIDSLALRPLRMVLENTAKKDHTRIDCHVVELDISNGSAMTKQLFLKTEKLLVAGVGRADLDTEKVDLVVRTKPAEKGLIDLFRGRHTVRVYGPISDLQVGADVGNEIVQAAMGVALLGAAVTSPPVFAAVTSVEYLDRFVRSDMGQACRP